MKVLKDLAVSGQITVGQLLQSSIDTDKFLVSDGGVVKFRTGSQLLGDIEGVINTRTITINGTAQDLTANRSWTVGDVRTDSSYANPAWITSLAWSKITGAPSFLTSEADTLATVTSRGTTTTSSVKFGSHVDLNPTNSAFRFYDGSTFRGGFGTDAWGHGGSDANLVLYVNGDNTLFFSTSGTKRASLSSSAFNSLVALQQGGNQVLHAGNYISYALRWNSTQAPASGLSNTSIVPNSVTLFDGYGAAVPNYPNNQWWVGALTMGDGTRGFQISGGYADSEMYFRKGQDGWQSWQRVWTTNNLTNLNQLTNGPGYITPNSTVSGWIAFQASTQGTPIIKAVQQDSSSGYYLFQGVTGSSEVFRVDRVGDIYMAGNLVATRTWVSSQGYLTSGSFLPLSGGTMTGTLTIGSGSVGSYIWNDGSGTYIEAYGNSTATRKIRIQGNNGSGSYAQWFVDAGNQQIYGEIGGYANLLFNSSTVYLRYNGSDKFWTGSDGTRTQGWAYFQTGTQGLHWPSNNWHFYPKDASDIYVRSGASDASIQFMRSGTAANYIHNASDNAIGFLSTSRSWILRVDNGGNTQVYGQLTVGNTTSSDIYMTDTDESTRRIHTNSGRIGFLNTSNNWGAYCDNSGNWFSDHSVRAPIFYDSNDTNYYVDPNSNSYLSRLHVADASSGVALHVGVGSTHGVYTLDNARKYLVVSGDYYPHMALVARYANNTNHGAVFSFVGSEGGAFRQWNLGISNNNPFLFSIGYNRTTDPNPHYGIGDGWSGSDNDHARLSVDRDGNTKIRGMLYVNGTSGGISTGSAVIHAGNIGSQSVNYASSAGNSDTVDGFHAAAFPYRSGGSSGYYQVADWMQFNTTAGLYWPSYNSAHIYPNTSTSYGSIRIDGSRNGWRGINFDGAVTLMMNNNETGFYRDGYGWQWRWENGTAYVNKNGQGGGTSATVLDSSNFTSYASPKNYVGDGYVDFYIYGDANTYYPVTIQNYNNGYGFQRYSISRGYSWTAPWDPIGTGSHKGGLTFTFDWSGDIAWGGNDKSFRVIQFAEQYTTMVAGMQLAHCEGVIVWLRGGGAGGAQYRLHGPGGIVQGYSINMSTWTSCAGVSYSPRSYDSGTVNSEINSKFPIRGYGNSDMYVNNNIVWHQGNLTNLSQLSNGPGYITSSSLSSYLPLSGGTMSGNLYIQSGANPTQFNLRGTNPELYVDAAYGGGTARLFINRQSTGNQATLLFTTGYSVSNGTAWNSTGTPLWTMGMTNSSQVSDFKIAYGDIYDLPSVAVRIDTNLATNVRKLYVGDTGSGWSDPGGWGSVLWVSNGPHSIIRVENRNDARQAIVYSHQGQMPAAGSGGDYDFRLVRNYSDRITLGSSYITMHTHVNMSYNNLDYVNQIYQETGGQGNYMYANNSGSYGTLRLTSTRNGWYGIYFDSGSTLMMNSNETGFYRQGYGWQWRWENGTAYVNKNSYGGGTAATVWDSSNAPRANYSNLVYYSGFTLNADTMPTNSTGFTYSVNAPSTGPIVRFGDGGYDMELNSDYYWGSNLYFRGRNGDLGVWRSWRRILNADSDPYAANMNQYVRTSDSVTFGAATLNGQVYINRHIDANTTWGNCGCTTIFVGWSTGKVMLGNGNTGGHDWSNDRPSNSVVSTMNHYFYNNIYAREDVVAYWSDARLKTNVKPIENALEKINKIGGYFYTPNQLALDIDATKDTGERVGVMAQEIEEVLPHVVKPAPFNENYKTVQYEKLVPLLIQGIKEQQKQIDELKEQLKSK